jgi:transcriptional regulator with XRE-family HTH domain
MTTSSDDSLEGNPRPKGGGGIDTHVGARIRERREQIGLSQEQLADLIGVSTPTVARYENGSMRVGVARLVAVSRVLNTTITYFFESMPELPPAAGARGLGESAEVPEVDTKNQVISKETVEIVRLCARLDAAHRRQLLALVRAWVAALSPPAAP